MKNLKKVLAVAASAAMVMTLTACGGSSSKYTKVGFGMITSVEDKGDYKQVNTTMATVGLDSKGKIQYIDLDVAQQDSNKDTEIRTKMEKKEDYNMKKVSKIGKELYEQVDFLETKLIGMTAEDVKNIEVYQKDEDHTAVPKEGSDIATGCTISIGEFQEAIQKAFDNMAEAKADKIGAGEVIYVDTTKGQVNTTVAQVALDSKGAIVWSNIDVAQTSKAEEVRSKMEKKEDYNMKGVSGIGKEFYEQVNFLTGKLKGMTADQVKAIEVYDKDEDHKSVPKEGTDIASGCTISIADFQTALAEAFETAK